MKNQIIIILIAFSTAAPAWCQSTLDDYVQYAIENNPGLKASYAEFEAAMQKVPQVGSLEDPSFKVSSFGQMVETRTGQQMARFTLEQMFPWFGTLKEQRNAAALNAEASFESFKSQRNEIILKVKQAYYPFYELDESIRINEENLKLLESFKVLAVSRFQNGQGRLSDALRVDVMSNEIKTDINILEEKRKSLTVAFNKLLNRDENEEVLVEAYDEGIVDELVSRDSLDRNPQLEVLRKRVMAAQAQEKVAQLQGLPKLGLGFEYIITQARPEISFPDNGKDAYMAMFSVSLPIYRKKYKAAVKESQLMQTSYTTMQQELENTLIAEYEMAVFELNRTSQQLALYNKQVDQTRQIITLVITSYANNNADLEEVLTMQQMLLKYQLLEVSARKEYNIAVAKLDNLTANY